MSRNVNPEWFYGWDKEPTDDEIREQEEIERALDDDADMYFYDQD